MIRHIWSSDSTEENGIVLLERFEAAVWDIFPGLLISFGGPVVVFEGQAERTVGFGKSLENFDTSIDDFWPNAIGRYASYAICFSVLGDGDGRHGGGVGVVLAWSLISGVLIRFEIFLVNVSRDRRKIDRIPVLTLKM